MKLEYITSDGRVLQLTNNDRFKLTETDGLTIAEVDIASSTVASMDGDFINNMQVTPRDIVLDLVIEHDVEATKRYILSFIKPKQKCTLRWTQLERTLRISGVVETIEMPRFTDQVTMQISIYCSQPFWEDQGYTITDISERVNLHYFTDQSNDQLFFFEEGQPFGEIDSNRTKTFYNNGDVSVGLEIHILALETLTNPRIYNDDGEFIGVDCTLSAGDEIIITTEKGNKTITLNGENIISMIRRGSTWLQLKTGESELTIDSDDGTEYDMNFTIIYKQRYV